MNLLQLCASAMKRLRSLGEEPGRRLERHSSHLLFRKELQCNTQSCYALLEEVSRKCLKSGHGTGPKSLAHPYSHPVWQRLEMGPVLEEMDLSVISYTPMRSSQSDVASAGLTMGDSESILALVLVITFPLQIC